MTDHTNPLRIIVDTHILVYREFDGYVPAEYRDLFKCINETRIPILVHPSSLLDIENDANLKNKNIILSKVKNYLQLKSPPDANEDDEFQEIINTSPDFRDCVDNQLLYCVYKNVADVFITNDRDIHGIARTLKISDRVITVRNASEFLRNRYNVEVASATNALKPAISFFNNGDFWEIGEKGRETHFKKIKGFIFISILLRNPNISFTALDLDQADRPLSEFIADDEARSNDLSITRNVLKLVTERGRISPKKVKKLISQYQKILETGNVANEEEASEVEQTIKILSESQKPKMPRDHKSQAEKARVNVYKRIHAALKKIHEKVPALELYLNKSTIKTGDNFCYMPVVAQEPEWIFEDTPSE